MGKSQRHGEERDCGWWFRLRSIDSSLKEGGKSSIRNCNSRGNSSAKWLKSLVSKCQTVVLFQSFSLIVDGLLNLTPNKANFRFWLSNSGK